ERLTYRAALDDGRVLLLRGFRAGCRLPFWHSGAIGEEWLRERALVLDGLARHGYPAPRVVRTGDGELLAIQAGYCALAITYLPGQPLPATTEHAQRLASALGRLHALGAWHGVEGSADLPASWWHPLDSAVMALLARLDGVRAEVPLRWRELHAAFAATLEAWRGRGDLPLTVIHGDCHPANAIETADRQVVLIDWDCAGRGTAVLDLGTLLLDAHPDPASGEPIAVDPRLVVAMVSGYRQYHEPTAQERECLLEATRFGVAFVGALRFDWAGEQGWSERIERSLQRLQARYVAAAEVAGLAAEAFDRRQ